MDDQDCPPARFDCPFQELFECFLCLRYALSVKIDVGLYGKFAAMESPGKLRMHVIACALNILRRIRNDEALSIFYEVRKLPDDCRFRGLFDVLWWLDPDFIPRAFVLLHRFHIQNGLEKNFSFNFRISGRLWLRFGCESGSRLGKRPASDAVLQFSERVVF